jgi:hypothetical protein
MFPGMFPTELKIGCLYVISNVISLRRRANLKFQFLFGFARLSTICMLRLGPIERCTKAYLNFFFRSVGARVQLNAIITHSLLLISNVLNCRTAEGEGYMPSEFIETQ